MPKSDNVEDIELLQEHETPYLFSKNFTIMEKEQLLGNAKIVAMWKDPNYLDNVKVLMCIDERIQFSLFMNTLAKVLDDKCGMDIYGYDVVNGICYGEEILHCGAVYLLDISVDNIDQYDSGYIYSHIRNYLHKALKP